MNLLIAFLIYFDRYSVCRLRQLSHDQTETHSIMMMMVMMMMVMRMGMRTRMTMIMIMMMRRMSSQIFTLVACIWQ